MSWDIDDDDDDVVAHYCGKLPLTVHITVTIPAEVGRLPVNRNFTVAFPSCRVNLYVNEQ